jgi:polyhydroxybutyrate depolymerase
MKKAVVLGLVGVLAVAGGAAAVKLRHGPPPPTPAPGATAPAGTTSYSVNVGGVNRTYDLYVPAGLDRTQPAPLLIELHGGGGNASGMERLTGFFGIADKDGFVVAAPNALNKSWSDGRVATDTQSGGDDIAFMNALIDQVSSQVDIDASRVYATGMSNGAIMSGRLACQLSNRIAAIAQVAGTASVDIAATCAPGRPVPVLEIHGTQDPLVPYGGGTVAAMLGGRGEVVGVDGWASFWAENDGASEQPTQTLGDDTTIRTWKGPTPASDVVFYRIEGAGHTWPDGSQYLPKFIIGSTTHTFDASEVIWQFLSAHRLAAA